LNGNANLTRASDDRLTVKQIVEAVEFWSIRVSHHTCWSFVRLISAEGMVGLGEATLNGQENAMVECLRSIASRFVGHRVDGPEAEASRLLSASSVLPLAAVVSAVAQAQVDLAAQAKGLRMCDLLGLRNEATYRSTPISIVERGIAHRRALRRAPVRRWARIL
jgi:L-alanine-DL-glutamate epimerase-like enolase superfamily enzyme